MSSPHRNPIRIRSSVFVQVFLAYFGDISVLLELIEHKPMTVLLPVQVTDSSLTRD